MSVLRLSRISKSFAGEDIVRDASLQVEPGQRAGLVGANGSGKTTLLRIVAGEMEPDAGQVEIARGTRLGYLRQDPEFGDDATVLLAARAAFADLDRMEERLRRLEAELAKRPDDEAALEEYGRIQHAFEWRGGYEREARVERVLAGLGFPPDHWDRPVDRLSGGQRIRLGLARLLLAAPDLLLLDEPTNHLDLSAIEWLEGHLAHAFRGAVLMVSHDRAFLDRTVDVVFALHDGTVETYRGNYSAYVRLREERQRAQEDQWRRIQEERARMEAFIRRYKAGTRATLAKSREKALARLPEVERPRSRQRHMNLRFEPGVASGREVLAIEGLAKSFGPTCLFRDFTAKVRRGERIGLVGPNGVGKTTLLRILAGEERPDAGEWLWGGGVELGYFTQDLSGIVGRGTVLDEIMDLGGFKLEEARSLLARFLFRGDDVLRPVAGLSGGERNRLLLARLVISKANVLLLDEPTNHLDIPAREVLEEALSAFPGTLFFTTHDRYFLRLATRLWIFEDGGIRDFKAGYAAWEAERLGESASRGGPANPEARAVGGEQATQASPPAGGKNADLLSKNEVQRLRRRLLDVEEEIARLESLRGALAARLAQPDCHRDEDLARETVRQYHETEEALDALYGEWERLAASGPGAEDSRGRRLT